MLILCNKSGKYVLQMITLYAILFNDMIDENGKNMLRGDNI